MGDLSPELQQLVFAGKLAVRPTDVDRARVFAALQARLGAGIAGGDAAVQLSATKSLGPSWWGKPTVLATSGLAVVIGGAAAVSLLAPRFSEMPAPVDNAVSITAPKSTIVVPAATAETREIADVAARPAHQETRPSAGASLGRSDSLSDEVAILARAEAEFRKGRATSALSVLGEHERRFKRGVLTEERIAAKIRALCVLGRDSEARALLSRLSPQSLHGQRARRACGNLARESNQ